MNLDSFEVAPVNGNILIVCLLIYLLIVLQKLACKCTIWVFIFYYLVATAMNGPCSEKVLWRNNSNGCFKIYWFPVKMLGIISLCSNLQFMKIKSFLVRPKNSPKQIKLIWLEIIFNLDFLLFFFFPTNSFCLMSSKCFHLCISDGTDHSFNNDVQSNQSNKIWFLPSRSFQFSSVQISRSVVSDSLQPHAACQASLSITNSWSSLKLMSIELVMPSNHLILCHPLFLLPPIPPSIRVFSNESTLPMRWLKYWSFSFSISPSNEHPGLIAFRMDWLDLLAVQGTLKSLLQHHSSKASIHNGVLLSH